MGFCISGVLFKLRVFFKYKRFVAKSKFPICFDCVSILSMENKQLSDNFWLKEFGYINPDPRLLLILQHLRTLTGAAVNITDAGRDAPRLIAIYKKLEAEKKIKTKGNGLGDKDLIDVIPWKSRHLPIFGNPNLRACDIQCNRKNTIDFYKGQEIYDMTMRYVESEDYTVKLELMGYKPEHKYVGIGVGHSYAHIDVDRTQHTTWRYGY